METASRNVTVENGEGGRSGEEGRPPSPPVDLIYRPKTPARRDKTVPGQTLEYGSPIPIPGQAILQPP